MEQIYRCADGHLFERSFWKKLLEANLGPGRHFAKCPVDGKRTTYTRVNRPGLSDEEVAQVQPKR